MLRELARIFSDWGGALTQRAVLVALLVLVACVVVLSSARLRAALANARRATDGPVATILATSFAVVRSLVGLAVLGALSLYLVAQGREFAATHGRVSETNLRSVQSIWGRAQAQRELRVWHSIEEVQVTRVSEEGECDGQLEAAAAAGKPVRVLRKKVKRTVPQNSILSTSGRVAIGMNYRKKGSAFYTTYENECRFAYEVKNFHGAATEASFSFPLASGCIFDGLRVLVDGEDVSSRLSYPGGSIDWTMAMQPGQVAKVEVSYRSRGMDSFYYQVTEEREIRSLALTIELADVAADRLNYPDGCITPTSVAPLGAGGGCRLEWTLANAISTRGMGVALPKRDQPGDSMARLLAGAPLGLVLLLGAWLATKLLTRRPVELLPAVLIAAAYTLLHTAAAPLADTLVGFYGALAIMVPLAAGLVAALEGRGMALALFLFFALVYPVTSVAEPVVLRDLLRQGVFVLLLAYAVLLAVVGRRAGLAAGCTAGTDGAPPQSIPLASAASPRRLHPTLDEGAGLS